SGLHVIEEVPGLVLVTHTIFVRQFEAPTLEFGRFKELAQRCGTYALHDTRPTARLERVEIHVQVIRPDFDGAAAAGGDELRTPAGGGLPGKREGCVPACFR